MAKKKDKKLRSKVNELLSSEEELALLQLKAQLEAKQKRIERIDRKKRRKKINGK